MKVESIMNSLVGASLLVFASWGNLLLAETAAPAPLAENLVDEVAGNGDLCATATGIGIDYPKLVARALAGEERAIGLILWFGEHGGTDAAASEGYSYSLLKLLKKLGDRKAAEAAQLHGPRSYSQIMAFLAFEFGGEASDKVVRQEVAREFPLLWKVMEPSVSEKPLDEK